MNQKVNFRRELEEAKKRLQKKLGISSDHLIKKVVVLGTGFGDKLVLENSKKVPFEEIFGYYELDSLDGHDRCFRHGFLDGEEVLTVARIHMNESSYNPNVPKMIRLMTEIPIMLGMQQYFVTAAVGSLNENIHTGDLVLVDSFLSLFAPPMSMTFTGEFSNPEDAISQRLIDLAKSLKQVYGREIKTGTHAMVRGPWFEGRKVDKIALRNNGADVVGMSLYPEVGIASMQKNIEVLPICFVTNGPSDEMNHQNHQDEAKKMAESLGDFMRELLLRS